MGPNKLLVGNAAFLAGVGNDTKYNFTLSFVIQENLQTDTRSARPVGERLGDTWTVGRPNR